MQYGWYLTNIVRYYCTATQWKEGTGLVNREKKTVYVKNVY